MFTKKPIPLLLFLFVLSLGVLTWLGSTNGCCMPGLLIKDGTTTIGSSSNNFHFGFGGAPAIGIGSVEGEMQKVADYLKNNPNKLLTINGFYGGDEKNTSTFENLGFARADDVKNYLIGLGAPAGRLLTGSNLKNDIRFNNDKTYDGVGWAFENITRSISFNDEAEGFSEVNDSYDFIFPSDAYNHKTPLSSELNTTLGKVAEYLKKGKRNMKIIGHYMESEKNTGALNDLGLSRANDIKKVFTDLGVPSNQLEIASAVKELRFINGEASDAASFEFFAGKDKSKLEEVEARLRANPLILYFDTNKSNLDLNATQRQYFTDLIYYLDNKEGGSVAATGHTDNKGKRANNNRLGRKRAEFVRNYLKRNNISESKVGVASKGQDVPVATNDTEEGRAKNRRVEISIN